MYHGPDLLLAGLSFPTLPEQLVNGLLLGAIYALIALGYTMVYGVLRLINFAHGEVYMLGAYVSLFVSYSLGFTPDLLREGTPHPLLYPGTLSTVGLILLAAGLLTLSLVFASRSLPAWLKVIGGLFAAFGAIGYVIAKYEPLALNLLLMMLASMVVCALVGMVIERFAYRPMRSHSRIASLITAIGVSLFLQYGGALFLPNSPPPSISEQVNPFRNSAHFIIVPPSKELTQAVQTLEPAETATKAAYDAYVERTHESEFDLKPEGQKLKDAFQTADSAYQNAKRKADSAGVSVTVQVSRIIMFLTAIILMLVLRHLVMFTPAGRAMRAVSHDFDSAALMGINVDRIVTFTFILGSALAGAGAMMTATFQGTPLTTFYGLLPGVKAFVAAVLGGIGNIPGAVLGGLLMGVAETLVVWVGYSEYKDAIAFVVLIIVLLFRPGGLLGSSKVEKV